MTISQKATKTRELPPRNIYIYIGIERERERDREREREILSIRVEDKLQNYFHFCKSENNFLI